MVHFNYIINYISLLTFMTTNTIQISYYWFITSPTNSNSNINIFFSTTNTTTTIISHSDYWQPPNWSPAFFFPGPSPICLPHCRQECLQIHTDEEKDKLLWFGPYLLPAYHLAQATAHAIFQNLMLASTHRALHMHLVPSVHNPLSSLFI